MGFAQERFRGGVICLVGFGAVFLLLIHKVKSHIDCSFC